MKLVLDTNKLYTIFWRGSLIDKLVRAKHQLYAPSFALEELRSHMSEICIKADITNLQFEEIISDIKKIVQFVPFSEYSEFMPRALLLIPNNLKDIDFVALALELNAAIVSDDKELKNQSEIKVFDRSEFSQLF